MKIRSTIMAAVLVLFATALAHGAAGNGARKNGSGYRLPASVLVSCPVMIRIKLSGKQVTEVKALEAETNGEIAAAFKSCEKDGKKKSIYYKKRGELLDGLNVKIAGLLTATQKKKYEAGRDAIAAYAAKVGKLRGDHLKAMRAASKDKARQAELRKQYQAKVRPMKAELEKQLDEKVGSRPVVTKKKSAK